MIHSAEDYIVIPSIVDCLVFPSTEDCFMICLFASYILLTVLPCTFYLMICSAGITQGSALFFCIHRFDLCYFTSCFIMRNLQSNSYYEQLYCHLFCRRLQSDSYYKRLPYDSSICIIYLFNILPYT